MKNLSKTFGKTGTLQTGDLVCWSGFSSQHIGLVHSLIERPIGGRSVVYAVVFVLKEQKMKEILCLNLKKLEIPEFSVAEN